MGGPSCGAGLAPASRVTSLSRAREKEGRRQAGSGVIRLSSTRRAAANCGCRPACTATPCGAGRGKGSSRWSRTRTSGARRHRRSSRMAAPRRAGSTRWPRATAGGCSRSRSPRSPRSGRGAAARACRSDMPLALTSSVKYLKGVGPRRAEALARLGIRSAGDLLYHAPHRYLDATALTPLARAQVGQDATCVGRVVSTGVLPTRRGLRVFRAVLRDASGVLECAWPGQPFLERQIKAGQLLLVTGPVRYYHGRQLVPREFIVLSDAGEEPDRGMVLPAYPATEGLTHRQIRGLVQQHLDGLLALVTDPHPPAWRATLAPPLPDLRTALAAVHRPASVGEAEQGRRRL